MLTYIIKERSYLSHKRSSSTCTRILDDGKDTFYFMILLRISILKSLPSSVDGENFKTVVFV